MENFEDYIARLLIYRRIGREYEALKSGSKGTKTSRESRQAATSAPSEIVIDNIEELGAKLNESWNEIS